MAMNQMNRMMNSMLGGPGFGMGMGMGNMGMGMLESPFAMGPELNHPAHHHHPRQPRSQEMMPFGGASLISPFGQIGRFPNFDELAQHNGNGGHSFSSMSVTSISSGPDGRPQVYQASKQTASGPGGVKETRKAVSDTRSGTKKMSVGRHLGERSHVREREENMFTGQREENEEFVNLDEGEAPTFDREWKQRAYGGGRYTHSTSLPAIADHPRREHRERERHHHRDRTGRHQQIHYHPTPHTEQPTASVTIEELPPSDDEEQGATSSATMQQQSAPTTSSPSASRHRSPYAKEKKPKSKRVRKY